MNDTVIEKLASCQHTIWSHWIRYMFRVGEIDQEGNLVLPKEKIEQWQKQMETKYEDLTEREKESDREVVEFNIRKVVEEFLMEQETTKQIFKDNEIF